MRVSPRCEGSHCPAPSRDPELVPSAVQQALQEMRIQVEESCAAAKAARDEVAALAEALDNIEAEASVAAELLDAGVPDPPLVLSAVMMHKVLTARTPYGAFEALAWLIGGVLLTALSLVSLVSVGVSLQWGPCFSQDDCRDGLVCYSFFEHGSYYEGKCEDCYFVAEDESVAAPANWSGRYSFYFPGSKSPEERLEFWESPNDGWQSASDYCMEQLQGRAKVIFEPADSVDFGGSAALVPPTFRQCLFIKEALSRCTMLDKIIIYLVCGLVAFGVAEDYGEQTCVKRLRQRYLPLPWRPRARSRNDTLHWLALLVLGVQEFLSGLVAPLVPSGIIFLLLTQGTDAASTLLNGLAMGFVLQLDNLVPLLFLDYRTRAKISASLTELAQKAAAERDPSGIHGFFRTMPYVSVVVVVLSFTTQVYTFFNDVQHLVCEMLIHHLHYRTTIMLGVWAMGACTFLVECSCSLAFFLGSPPAMRGSLTAETLRKPALRFAVAAAGRFARMLLSAFTLNVLYWYVLNGMYYQTPLAHAFRDYFSDFVGDLFGACGNGYGHNECLEQGPPGWEGAFAP